MQNNVVTGRPLALLAKLAAAALAIGGTLLMRSPQAADLVVVVLAPGVALERVESAVALQRAPKIASLLATGLTAQVSATGPLSGLSFWRRVLATSPSVVGAGAKERPLWSSLGDPTLAVGVPDVLFPESGDSPGAGGAAVVSGFVGTSTAVPVTGADLKAAHLPAPYDGLSDTIRSAANSLEPGRWSAWIEAGEDRSQRLQILCASGDRCFLSPIYRTQTTDGNASAPVILSDPFVTPVDPDVRAAFVEHLVSIDDTRCTAVERHLASGRDLRSVFYAFTAAAASRKLAGGESPDSSTDARVLAVLDERLARLSSAAGERGVIVVIGGPGLGREPAGAAWMLVSSGQGSSLGRATLDVPKLAGVLRYLLGAALRTEDRAELPAALTARYPHRSGIVRDTGGSTPPPRVSAWNADAIESLLHGSGT